MSGIGVEKDKSKAFEYYKKSAEKGCNIAQNNLGFLYENGEVQKKTQKKLFVDIIKQQKMEVRLHHTIQVEYMNLEWVLIKMKTKHFIFIKNQPKMDL